MAYNPLINAVLYIGVITHLLTIYILTSNGTSNCLAKLDLFEGWPNVPLTAIPIVTRLGGMYEASRNRILAEVRETHSGSGGHMGWGKSWLG